MLVGAWSRFILVGADGLRLSCDYLHQTRVDRLSDHSALSVRLAIEPSEPLITSAPATASAPPTLF